MEKLISQYEYDYMKRRAKELEQEKQAALKKLGEILDTSGSFAAKTPGYLETEDKVYYLDKKISALNELIINAKIIEKVDDLASDVVTIYSLVEISDQGENKKYYIQYHRDTPLPAGIRDAKSISFDSPLAAALSGSSSGQTVEVKFPNQTKELTIINIKKIVE